MVGNGEKGEPVEFGTGKKVWGHLADEGRMASLEGRTQRRKKGLGTEAKEN